MRHIWRFCIKSGAFHIFASRSMTLPTLVHIGLYLPKLCPFQVFADISPCWDSNPRPLKDHKLSYVDSTTALYSYGYSNFALWLTMCRQHGCMLFRIVNFEGTRGNLARSGTGHVTQGTKIFAPSDSHNYPLSMCKAMSAPVVSFPCC